MKLNNRFTLFLFGLLLTIGASAQPLTYYQDAWNEDGDDLREALYDIIRVHTKLPYSSSSTDTWDVLKASDVDPSNNTCWLRPDKYEENHAKTFPRIPKSAIKH